MQWAFIKICPAEWTDIISMLLSLLTFVISWVNTIHYGRAFLDYSAHILLAHDSTDDIHDHCPKELHLLRSFKCKGKPSWWQAQRSESYTVLYILVPKNTITRAVILFEYMLMATLISILIIQNVWIVDVVDVWKSSVSVTGTVQQKNFVSQKFRQKRPSGSSSGVYFRQTSDRLFCLRSFGSLAYRLSSHSWLFLIQHLSFCGKFSQEFNLVKKLLWRKRRN